MNNDAVNYILDAALILMVIFQIRGRSLSIRQLLLPIAIVTYFALDYLKTFPTAGNDLIMEVSGAVLGTMLGLACGLTTRVVARADGVPIAKATWLAAGLWLFGMCGRLFFQVWVEHGGGAATVGAFSAANGITSGAAWADCLVLMALTEVLGRTLVLAWQGVRLPGGIPMSARSGVTMAAGD
ncbi:MAG: hypothetical protein ABSB52_13660 [Acidimicrobiales bacterium]|jgi:hypothetical protein